MHKRLYHITDTDVVEASLESMSRGNRCDITELHVYDFLYIEEKAASRTEKKTPHAVFKTPDETFT